MASGMEMQLHDAEITEGGGGGVRWNGGGRPRRCQN